MKLSDTIKGMTSEDYKERFRAEYEQLLIRLRGLMKMLDSYKNVLDLRATVEGIELSESEENNESNCN